MEMNAMKLLCAPLMAAGISLGFLHTASAQSDSVLYLDNELTINNAIVVEAGKIHYYKAVRLLPAANGDFRVVEAIPAQMAYVNELSVAVSFTDPVEVELGITGYKSNPCVDTDIAVTRRANTFYVAVGETSLPPNVGCAAVIGPFDVTFPLDVKGLGAGDYRVVVNDDEIDFTIE